MKTRTLKVEQLNRKSRQTSRPTHYPGIRLKGNWMQEAGFAPGMMATVEVSQNQIIIKL
jgi:hypothetical protein